MSDLSPEAAALLEAARRSHGPDERDRERVLTSLHVSLGIAVPLAAASSVAHAAQAVNDTLLQSGVQSSLQTSLTGSAAQGALQSGVVSGKSALGLGAKLLTWKAGKILLATVALGSAVGVTAVQRATRVETETSKDRSTQAIARGRAVDATRGEGTAAPRAAPERTHEPEAVPAPVPEPVQVPALNDAPVAQATSEKVESVAPVSSQTRVSKATVPRSRHGRRTVLEHKTRAASTRTSRHAEPASPPVANEVAPAAAIPVAQPASETELIRKVLTSLRDRNEEAALALLDEHAARYPNGAFATERRGLHVVALCAAGRIDEGKSEQKAFLKQAGKAPIAARVRSACSEPAR